MPCPCSSGLFKPKPVVPLPDPKPGVARVQKLVGTMSPYKPLDDDAKDVLTKNFNVIKTLKGLQGLTLDSLTKNTTVAKQLVAGTNYKFKIEMSKKFDLVIWKKLNNTYQITSFKNVL